MDSTPPTPPPTIEQVEATLGELEALDPMEAVAVASSIADMLERILDEEGT